MFGTLFLEDEAEIPKPTKVTISTGTSPPPQSISTQVSIHKPLGSVAYEMYLIFNLKISANHTKTN